MLPFRACPALDLIYKPFQSSRAVQHANVMRKALPWMTSVGRSGLVQAQRWCLLVGLELQTFDVELLSMPPPGNPCDRPLVKGCPSQMPKIFPKLATRVAHPRTRGAGTGFPAVGGVSLRSHHRPGDLQARCAPSNSLAGDVSNSPTFWLHISGAARLPPTSIAAMFERSMSNYLPIEGALQHAGLVLIDLIRSCLSSDWPSGIVLGGHSLGSGGVWVLNTGRLQEVGHVLRQL